MKAILEIAADLTRKRARKEIDIPFVPSAGMCFYWEREIEGENALASDEANVSSVVYEEEKRTLTIYFEEFSSPEIVDAFVKCYGFVSCS